MAIQIRIMGHKRRPHDDLTNTLKGMGFEVKDYLDTSDDYKLENNMAERHKGAQYNLVRMITDFELPEDNNGFIIMAEDDVIPIPTLYKTLEAFIHQAPCDRCYSGFHMRFEARQKETGQIEHISPYVFLNTQFWLMPLELAKEFDEWRKTYPECYDGYLWWNCPKAIGKQFAPTDVFVNKFIKDRGDRPLCIYPNLVEHKHVESLCDNKWLHKNGVPRNSVWFDPDYDFTKIKWERWARRYDRPVERRVWR